MTAAAIVFASEVAHAFNHDMTQPPKSELDLEENRAVRVAFMSNLVRGPQVRERLRLRTYDLDKRRADLCSYTNIEARLRHLRRAQRLHRLRRLVGRRRHNSQRHRARVEALIRAQTRAIEKACALAGGLDEDLAGIRALTVSMAQAPTRPFSADDLIRAHRLDFAVFAASNLAHRLVRDLDHGRASTIRVRLMRSWLNQSLRIAWRLSDNLDLAASDTLALRNLAPSRPAQRVIALALRILPPASRARWAEEYQGELAALATGRVPRIKQVTFGLHVLLRALEQRHELRPAVQRPTEPQ